MFRSVIVPLDGSLSAEAAIPYAADQANRHGAALVLVRVVARPELWPGSLDRGGPLRRAPVWPVAEVAAEERQGFAYLNDVARRFGLPDGTVAVVPIGDPCLRLSAVLRRRPAALAVVAERAGGRSAATRGGLVHRLLRSGVAPVLAVRADGEEGAVASAVGDVASAHAPTA